MKQIASCFRGGLIASAFAVAACASLPVSSQTAEISGNYLERLPQDEVIYFVLPDRFENGDTANDRGMIEGDKLAHGFDPENPGFYHGGDLAGLQSRLDYIQALGATAIWFAPIFQNNPVQPTGDSYVSGYHGYWVTDFTNVDPHFGTRDEFKAFVDAAHARGMKVYMDIITNHTADIIQYRECHDPAVVQPIKVSGDCVYRSIADYPWTTQGGPDGEAINSGFMGDAPEYLTPENYARLERSDYAYTPYVPAAQEEVKTPAWLNDPKYYHNRGDTKFEGENSLYGDFYGLDDLMTEDPFVVDGMIEIFKAWITDYRVDGFRIDTAKHVRPEFWQQFAPAMLDHASSLGIENFHIFGETYDFDPAQLARYTIEHKLPAVLDFAFQGIAVNVIAQGEPARQFEGLFAADTVYKNGAETAAILPTFLGNHDMGRFAGFVRTHAPEIGDDEILARTRLAHAIMMFSRGVPVIYYGDEQGFISDSNDHDTREDMFPSQVSSYNDNDLVGTSKTTADSNFDREHPLFKAIARMTAIRSQNVTLRRGAHVVRHTDLEGGVLAFSRIDRASGEEFLIVANADTTARTLNVVVDGASRDWNSVIGTCQSKAKATASYAVTVPALDFVICKSPARN